jgi:hypothetical protein
MTGHHGEFSGEPLTRWCTEDCADRKMKLEEPFHYVDPEDKTWLAPEGCEIDGASIPRALWALVGSPFTGDYRRASIVHDQACRDASGDLSKRRAADRMFFHACRAGGCTIEEATTLYLGVRIGAMGDLPLWRDCLQESYAPRPRTSIPARERSIEADFRVAAELLAEEEPTDDPAQLEARVDQVLEKVVKQ